MLFVDEGFADTAAGRGPLGSLGWLPVVRFRSLDYDYVRDGGGGWRIVQRGLGTDHVEATQGLTSFRQPSARGGAGVEGDSRPSASCGSSPPCSLWWMRSAHPE